MATTYQPIQNNLLVELLPREGVSEGGIILPNIAQNAHEWGTVRATGPDVREDIQDGDEIFIPPHSGTIITLGAQDFILIKDDKVPAKREPESPQTLESN